MLVDGEKTYLIIKVAQISLEELEKKTEYKVGWVGRGMGLRKARGGK